MADRGGISLILGVLALAIGMVVAGCGSGGSGSSTGPTSKAEFIRKANAICDRDHRQGEAEFRDYIVSLHGDEPHGSALAAAQRKIAETILIPLKQQEIEELAELGAPKGDGKQVKAISAAIEEGIETTEKSPEEAVVYSASAFGKSSELATKYGLGLNC